MTTRGIPASIDLEGVRLGLAKEESSTSTGPKIVYYGRQQWANRDLHVRLDNSGRRNSWRCSVTLSIRFEKVGYAQIQETTFKVVEESVNAIDALSLALLAFHEGTIAVAEASKRLTEEGWTEQPWETKEA